MQNLYHTIRELLRLGVLMLLLAAFAAPLAAQSVRPPGDAVNLEDDNEGGPSNTLGDVSISEIWNNFRGGDPADLLAPSLEGQVMTTTGQQWRLIREQYIRKYLGWAPVIVIALLAVFYLIRGPLKIAGGRSGKTIPRFSLAARVAHWFMAGVFIILGFTGLIILLGRPLIGPYLGLETNSVLSSASLQGHNLFGPIFIFALIWLFIKFIRGNFFHLVDLKWIFKFGGMFGGHVHAGRYNFGEKAWFWLVILVGTVISITGVIMLFPGLVEDVRWLQLSTVLHAIGAVGLIAVAFGHIYLGSIGMEGSIDSMLKGEVDENWAKEHHDLWYEEVTKNSAKEEKDVS